MFLTQRDRSVLALAFIRVECRSIKLSPKNGLNLKRENIVLHLNKYFYITMQLNISSCCVPNLGF